MKQNLTELVFILDRSGSMSGLETETIGGYNSLLKKQKKMDGEANVTTILFNQEYEILHDRKPIRDVKPISSKEYYACGFTALLDAIQEACSLGIRPQMSRTYSADKKGVESIFNAVGQVVNALRSPRFLSKDEFYDACDSLLDDVK
jgi:uncharacterized protein YegL